MVVLELVPVPVPEVLDEPIEPELDGDVLDDDVPPEDDGLVVAELLVPDGVVDDELLVEGPLIELDPVVDGVVVLLVSVDVDDELDDAGGVAGVVVVVELELVLAGGLTTVLLVSLRSQPARPTARAMARALDSMILDFMGNSFPCCGDGQRKLTATPPFPAASTRKFGATRTHRPAPRRK